MALINRIFSLKSCVLGNLTLPIGTGDPRLFVWKYCFFSVGVFIIKVLIFKKTQPTLPKVFKTATLPKVFKTVAQNTRFFFTLVKMQLWMLLCCSIKVLHVNSTVQHVFFHLLYELKTVVSSYVDQQSTLLCFYKLTFCAGESVGSPANF